MLILTRKEGERIRIGQDVIVTVVEICGPRVSLGIQAPAHICVDREEVRESKNKSPGGRSP